MREGAARIDGLILAGGRARRLGGGDKGMLQVGDSTVLARVVATLGPQVDHLLLSANGDPARFADVGLDVVADEIDEAGPLGGLLAGLDWTAAYRPGVATLLSVPGDTPFLPRDLVSRLAATGRPGSIAMAASGGRVHPTVALWPVVLRQPLRIFLAQSATRSVRAFAERHGVVYAEWPDRPRDPFANVNTPEDLARARAAAFDDVS